MGAETFNSFVYDTPEKTKKSTTSESKSITIGVFFDGTCNNSYNVAARIADNKAYHDYDGNVKKETSYDNAPSNVERLWNYYTEEINLRYRIYIEGAGTSSSQDENGNTTYGSDDTVDGTGFGMGKNGIRGKVLKACQKSADIIKKQNNKISQITFDVFGFSRGAAEARNFVYELMRPDGIETLRHISYIDIQNYETQGVPKYGLLGYFMKQNGVEISDIAKISIQIRFVGIFDTVSSYAPDYTLSSSKFSNDVTELHLNSVNTFAKKLIHLTAADEHRKNFALTHIAAEAFPDLNTEDTRKRIEISLPGVHSDVGGCYVNNATEEVQIQDYDSYSEATKTNLETLKQQLINQGWFKEYQLKINNWNELLGTRSGLSNKYSFIPLHFMNKFAIKFYKGMFNNQLTKDYSILDPYNPKFAEPMAKYIQLRFENNWMPYWEKQDAEYEKLIIQNTSTINLDFGRPVYGYGPNPLDKRLQELLAEIDMNLNMNGLDVCPSEDIVLCYAKHILEKHAFENQPTMIYKTAQDIVDICWGSDFINPKVFSDFSANKIREKLPQLKEEIIKQVYLRILRNKLLHWSAQYGAVSKANVPAPNRQRANY